MLVPSHPLQGGNTAAATGGQGLSQGGPWVVKRLPVRPWSPWGGTGGRGAGGSCAWASGSADAGGDTECLGGSQRRSSLVLVPELRPTGSYSRGAGLRCSKGTQGLSSKAVPDTHPASVGGPAWCTQGHAVSPNGATGLAPHAPVCSHRLCWDPSLWFVPRRAVITCFSWSSPPDHAPICTHIRTALAEGPEMRNLIIVERTPETQVQPCRCNQGAGAAASSRAAET